MTSAEEAFYEWQIRIDTNVFQTTGGRTIECDNGDGNCVYIQNATPGIYLIEGSVEYDVVLRSYLYALGVDTFRQDRDRPISFFVQVIAPFVEPNQD